VVIRYVGDGLNRTHNPRVAGSSPAGPTGDYPLCGADITSAGKPAAKAGISVNLTYSPGKERFARCGAQLPAVEWYSKHHR